MRRSLMAIGLLILLSVPAQATTLKIATLVPDGTYWMKTLRQGAAEVKKRTADRVKIRFYPGGVMGTDKSVLRKIRVGQLHGAVLTSGGLGQIYPDSLVYGLPFLFRSFAEVDYIRQHMDKSLLDGLQKKGYISFGIMETGFAYLFSKDAIHNPEAMKGRKIWSPENDLIIQDSLSALGVSAVPLPITDVLTSLQTGLIDTVGNSPGGAIALQWHTKVKYMTDTPLFYLISGMVVQKKAFSRLSKKDQTILREVMVDIFKGFNRHNRQDNAKARQALRKQGIEFVAVEPNEQITWEETVSKAMDELAQQGVFSRSALQQIRQHLTDYRRAKGG